MGVINRASRFSLGNRASRFSLCAIVAAFVVTAGGISTANAQKTPTPTLTVSAFLADPGQLLQQYQNGGPILISTVEQFALADPTTFKALLGLLATANGAQKSAIGAGLAQAAKVEVLTNQALAADWQQQIGAITDASFKTAATNAFGDVQLGGIGGGPLGGTGGGGGGQTAPLNQSSSNSGPAQNFQSTPVATSNFTYSSSVSAANSPPSNPTSP